MKKVLIISTSPRKSGNSNVLCQKVYEGAKAAGADVELVRSDELSIAPCKACNACRKTGGVCVIKDDMADLLKKMSEADAIVMATPLYFYTLSAQIKLIIDRTYCAYNIAPHNPLENKEWYLIVSSETSVKQDLEIAVDSFKGFLRCVSGSKLVDVLYATGTSIEGKANADRYFDEAVEMGKRAAE